MGNACPFQSQVEAYHDGELADVTARAALESHLAGCATCADDLAFLRRVSATLARPDSRDVMSPSALDRIHDAIDGEADAADAARFDIRRLYRAAGALSAVAASVLVLSCTWLNTLSAPPTGRGGRGLTNPPSVAVAPAGPAAAAASAAAARAATGAGRTASPARATGAGRRAGARPGSAGAAGG